MLGVGGGPIDNLLFENFAKDGLVKSRENYSDVLFAGGKANLSDVAARVGLVSCRTSNASARSGGSSQVGIERWSHNHTLRLPARGDAGHSWHIFAPLLPL